MALDMGTVPAWLGAFSIVIAFSVFMRDRNERDRAQVERVGIWTTAEYERKLPWSEDRVETGKITFFARNSTDLPVELIRVAYEIRTRWDVPDVQPDADEEHPEPRAWTVTPGVTTQMIFSERMQISPQDTLNWSSEVNFAHMAPESASQPAMFHGLDCRVKWALVIDNAGRRWEVTPSRGRRPKRVRWYHRPLEHQPRDWEQW